MLFLVFQDDMLELAVCGEHRNVVINIQRQVSGGTLGIELGEKPEAKYPFQQPYNFIGAEFNTADIRKVSRLSPRHFRVSLKHHLTSIRSKRCYLVDQASLHKIFSWLTFCVWFLDDGRGRLNSAYPALAGARHLKSHELEAISSTEMVRDVNVTSAAIHEERCTAIVSSTNFEILGSQAVSFDASLIRRWGPSTYERVN